MKTKGFIDFLERYEEESIHFLQKYEPPEGYFLGFSGGKDSLVMKHLAERSGVKFQSYYSATGIDPPELVKYIKQYHKDVIFLRPEKSFFKLIIYKKILPTQQKRWCCITQKEKPSLKISLKNRLMGIRKEESYNRAKRPQIDYIKKQKCFHIKPIFHWPEWAIWDYIEKYNLEYCSLYNEGFSRIGCVVCPFLCGGNQIYRNKNRWPKFFNVFEREAHKLWLIKKNKLIENTFEEFLQNWYDAKSLKKENKGFFF